MSPNIPLELTNPETEIIISNNPEEIRNESESISNKTETIANKITEEFAPVSVDSSGQKGGVKKAKKRFPCRECGKVYLLAGWLKTHRKMHKNERILEEKRRQLMMMKEFGQNDNKEEGQSLMETSIIQNKQKKKKKSLGLQESLDNKKKKKNQLTNAVVCCCCFSVTFNLSMAFAFILKSKLTNRQQTRNVHKLLSKSCYTCQLAKF